MSSRERWVVYPLLFLTLGTVMRDKIVGSRVQMATTMYCNELHCNNVEAGRALCNSVSIAGLKGNDSVRLGTAPNGSGVLELADRDGAPLVIAGDDVSSRVGVLRNFAPQESLKAQLAAKASAGTVTLLGHGGKVLIVGPGGEVRFPPPNPPAAKSRPKPPAESPPEPAPKPSKP